jgi:hypothetical protein
MEPLIAIGTVGLAAVTAWLAWSTSALAKSAAAQLETARLQVERSHRPVLVPASATNVGGSEGALDSSAKINLRNVGMGPALNVRGEIEVGDVSSTQGHGVAKRPLQSIAVCESTELEFVPLGGSIFPQVEVRVRVSYTDLAAQPYYTDLQFNVATRVWRTTVHEPTTEAPASPLRNTSG